MRVHILHFVFLFVLVPIGLQAQWQQLNGPYGGAAGRFATIGNSVFTFNSEHIYRSLDLGDTWEEVGRGQVGSRLEVLVAMGDRLFLSCEDSIYISSDKGRSWKRLSKTFDRVSSMVVMDSTLFAACYYDFFVSTDFGESWISILEHAPFEYPFHVVQSGSHLFLTRRGHYVSTDRGLTWKQMTDSTQRRFNSFLVEGNLLYGGSDQGLHVSTDLGTSWTRIANELKSVNVLQIRRVGEYLFAVTNKGIFRSSTIGLSWEHVLLPRQPSKTYSIESIGDRLLVSHSTLGIYMSKDEGTSWHGSNHGLIATSANSLLYYGDRMFAACGFTGLFVSNDLGAEWQRVSGFDDVEVKCLEKTERSIIVGTSRGWYQSLDAGRTWTLNDDSYTKTNSTFSVCYKNGLLAVISNYARCVLYTSFDDGVTWKFLNETKLPIAPLIHTYNTANQVLIDSGVVYVIVDGGMSVSTTEGKSWRHVDASLFGRDLPMYITGLGAHGNNLVISGWGYRQFRSTDLGLTWTQIGQEEEMEIQSFYRYRNGFIAVCPALRFIADKSTSWVDISGGLKTAYRGSIDVVDDFMYISGSGSGVWRKPTSQIVGVDVETGAQHAMPTVTVSPIPVHTNATITINSFRESCASIEVVNTLGEVVLSRSFGIVSEGTRTFLLDTQTLSSGWYTAVVKVGDDVIVGRFVVESQ